MLPSWVWLVTVHRRFDQAALAQLGVAFVVLLACLWLLSPSLSMSEWMPLARPTWTPTRTRVVATRWPTPTHFLPTATAQPLVHIVLEGEVLGLIAEEYGTSAAAILEANALDDEDLLTIGQELVIPDAQRTPVLVLTPSPTATPTAVFAYYAPRLIAPPDQFVYSADQPRIVLQWTSVAVLAPDQWYEVRFWHVGGIEHFWTQASSFVVPEVALEGAERSTFFWDVTVVAKSEGLVRQLSPRSPTRRLGWHLP